MKIRFRNKPNGMLKEIDVSLSPIEGLLFHQAILRYSSDPNENEIDRADAKRMYDDFNAEMKKVANGTSTPDIPNIVNFPKCTMRTKDGKCSLSDEACVNVDSDICEARHKNKMFDWMIWEYVKKCESCKECFAHSFCTSRGFRESTHPQPYCKENIKAFLQEKL